jgi:hypothetical protein
MPFELPILMIFAFIVLLLQCNYNTNVINNLKWREVFLLGLALFWMVASQHPIRIGLTQSPLKTSVPDVFAFSCSSAKSSKLVSRLRTKKPTLFAWAL